MADRFGRRLLGLAAAFVFIQALILTLSPAVRERSWAAGLRWSHWLGVIAWLAVFVILLRLQELRLPHRDPFILPLCALLSGWGILTIWRLDPSYGGRQLAWLALSAFAVVLLMPHWVDLAVLRKYKYLLLATGLVLTALTIFLGTSPTGNGPRLWLGCCGIYLQPSEPLKLLLVVYLAAYLADNVQVGGRAFPMLLPTILVAGLAILLLLVQRDLGSASILILLYTIILYVATGRRRVLIVTFLGVGVAALVGFLFVDVVRTRLETWLNPWTDPSGLSYQIVQSLMAVANGGVFGRGLGLGSPGLVPVPHSDFIYTAIAEENGLLGGIALLVLYGLLFSRGFVVALRASNRFHRFLAIGLTAYLGVQSLLIIGGDLRLLPLTGVTLPFVSYGGSSLLTSAVAAAMLMTISSSPEGKRLPMESQLPSTVIAALLAAGIFAAALMHSWWTIVRGPALLTRTDNARRSIADRYVVRGSLLDRNGEPISMTVGSSGSLRRNYVYPALGPIVGYTHPTFGQAGLEASLDDYLRGLQGNPASLVIWDQLVYGTPPPGLDIRLTIDLAMQDRADALLGAYRGAIVMLNANSGEVLVMASHPTYDANQLDVAGKELLHHEGTPLLNRATQGTYRLGNAAQPLAEAAGVNADPAGLREFYERLGLYSQPGMRMPVAVPVAIENPGQLHVSPLQLAVAAASLSNHGIRPSPRLALAVNTPRESWVVLPALDETVRVLPRDTADATAIHFGLQNRPQWQWRVTSTTSGQTLTWYVAGTLPDWQGSPLTVVVLLESADVAAATTMGTELLAYALNP
ncbi:MAG TPA: FtsW/RodA/SpoVE family cell cycle protein [Anaerolineales bacterium]